MKESLLAGGLVAVVTCAGVSFANAGTVIPYPNAGSINSESYNFTAAATGDVIGYFYGSSAGGTDVIGMSVNGNPVGSFGLNNQSSSIGTSFNLGSVNAGDVITFVLRDVTASNPDISSNPAFNSDLAQHIYSVAYTNPGAYQVAGIPTGTFVAFEDLLSSQGSDFDYNDNSFVFTNLSSDTVGGTVGTTPLMAALPLFTTGLGVFGLLAHRKKRRHRGHMHQSI